MTFPVLRADIIRYSLMGTEELMDNLQIYLTQRSKIQEIIDRVLWNLILVYQHMYQQEDSSIESSSVFTINAFGRQLKRIEDFLLEVDTNINAMHTVLICRFNSYQG